MRRSHVRPCWTNIALLLVALGAWLPASGAGAVEPWADSRLEVTQGLVLWLDAARQPQASEADGRAGPGDGARLDVWYDGSGGKRHVQQPAQDAQPRFVAHRDGAAVRFDGVDDFLSLAGQELRARDVTLCVLTVPRSNRGYFRALFGMHQRGKNDYTSGLNFDFGAQASAGLESLCVEGAGFPGSRSLLSQPLAFGEPRVLVVSTVTRDDSPRVALWVDGAPQQDRTREPAELRGDQLIVGARCYSNSAEPPFVSGHFDGEIAEVLLYDRALDDAERDAVQRYLLGKVAGLREQGRYPRRPLVVREGPPVEVLVPGFEVAPLPLDLPNINDLAYLPDGSLLAACYNGTLLRLVDTNDDGLEDRAEVAWDKAPLKNPIALLLVDDGVLVSSQGRISLLRDQDGDGRYDSEEAYCEGWEPPRNYSGGVDVLGLARDAAGDLYFGLGVSDYTNAHLLKEGVSEFRLSSQRSTIQRRDPQGKLSTFCTGVRFPIALAFNERGDLFATDQEGATWMPNGNPFDELLHLQPGRHYGFPPSHPRHLPQVIDEPSVVDYSPQHQSTCGLMFNESRTGPTFGPPSWRGDAFVAGYSRGKLWRTRLVKEEAGYVAQTELFACLRELTVDVCLSPRGDLVVACHSGGPDWGSGPGGRGKLYRIRAVESPTPRPVAAWLASPREVRIAFDRELDGQQLSALGKELRIEGGEHVRPGDSAELHRPGYAVVQRQSLAPRFAVSIESLGITADRRELVVATAPHPPGLHYALELPSSPTWGAGFVAGGDATPRRTPLACGYSTAGVTATWQSQSAPTTTWEGWLPHLDRDVWQRVLEGSAEHERLAELLATPGRLTLRTRLRLDHLLRPVVQPGSQLDHTPAPEHVTIRLAADRPFTVRLHPRDVVAGERGAVAAVDDSHESPALALHELSGSAEELSGRLLEVGLPTAPTSGGALRVTWSTTEDPRPRPLATDRLLLPWSVGTPSLDETPVDTPPAELAGGSWGRGRRLFFGEAFCSRCHALHGAGQDIGPDLGNLIHRDYASVLRDVTLPSYAIHPDHLSYSVELGDGRVLTGTMKSQGDELIVADGEGKRTTVRREDVERIRPSIKSIMPEGLPAKLGPDKLRDLLTFLMTPPPRMPEYGPLTPPPPRKRGEVQAVLAGAPATGATSSGASDKSLAPVRPLRLLLVDGAKDHGLGEHDYPAWRTAWEQLLGAAEGVTVDTAHEFPTAEQLAKCDVAMFFQRGEFGPLREAALDQHLERGGGLVFLHWAVEAGEAAPRFAERIGLASNAAGLKFRHGPLDLRFDPEHPVARNLREPVHFHDESYWQMVGDERQVRVLATGVEDDAPRPLFWTLERGKGRVFVSILGHYAWTFDDPLFRVLVLRGALWTAREPVDRLNELVWPGARVQ